VKILAQELAEKTREDKAVSAQVGACVYFPPGSNTSYCFQMTPQQCSAVQGTYLGGPCKR
jgi:phage pi2 protein 07